MAIDFKPKSRIQFTPKARPDMGELQAQADEARLKSERISQGGGIGGALTREAVSDAERLTSPRSAMDVVTSSAATAILPGGETLLRKPTTAGVATGILAAPVATLGGLVTGQLARMVTPERGVDIGPMKNVSTQDIAEGFGDLAGGILGEASQKIAGGVSGRIINSMVKPQNKHFLFGKDPGGEVARQGIVANNLDDLAKRITERVDQLTDNLENVVATSRSRVNASPVMQVVDDAISELLPFQDTASGQINALLRLRSDLSRFNLTDMSARQAINFKRQLGKLTKWATTLQDDVMSAVGGTIRKAYGTMDNLIDTAVPGTAGLNKQISNLLSAQSATLLRSPIEKRSELLGLTSRLTGIVGGSIAGGPVGAGLGYIGGALAEEAMRSPAVQTRAASLLGKYSTAGRGVRAGMFPATGRSTDIAGMLPEPPIYGRSVDPSGAAVVRGRYPRKEVMGNIIGPEEMLRLPAGAEPTGVPTINMPPDPSLRQLPAGQTSGVPIYGPSVNPVVTRRLDPVTPDVIYNAGRISELPINMPPSPGRALPAPEVPIGTKYGEGFVTRPGTPKTGNMTAREWALQQLQDEQQRIIQGMQTPQIMNDPRAIQILRQRQEEIADAIRQISTQ